jgi:CheY-like chemotaxis protein
MPEGDKVAAKTLVLIDDDQVSHFIFKALITRLKPDLTITSYTSALATLSEIPKKEFHATAIILDINMPGMTGWEFLAEMRTLQLNIPVYMLSSSTDETDRLKISDFPNVQEYFVKPLVDLHLKKILESHFR